MGSCGSLYCKFFIWAYLDINGQLDSHSLHRFDGVDPSEDGALNNNNIYAIAKKELWKQNSMRKRDVQ